MHWYAYNHTNASNIHLAEAQILPKQTSIISVLNFFFFFGFVSGKNVMVSMQSVRAFIIWKNEQTEEKTKKTKI